jgi:hypothetical protein
MTLYETIFARRAVRKFDMTPLAGEILDDIIKFIKATKHINGQDAQFEIAAAGAVSGQSAPHYILAFCEEQDQGFANVGYVLAKTDLYMQSIGLGTCWLGMAKPKANNEKFCILLAFGKTNVPVRKGAEEFKRLPVSEISDADNEIAQAARLAPSAMNSQPWKLHFEDNKIIIRYFGRGMMKAMLKKKMSKIDAGIVTRYTAIALEKAGKQIQSITPHTSGNDFDIEILYE